MEEFEEKIKKHRQGVGTNRFNDNRKTYIKTSYTTAPPSVLVKIVSKGSQDNLYAALKYITQEIKNEQENAKNGSLQLENQNGEMVDYKDVIDEYSKTMSTRKNGKDFYHMVLSTKQTSNDEKQVREAIRKTLINQFGDKGYDYTFIAHTDTDNLHYHVIINKHNKFKGNRLDVTKETLYNTRKQFSDELNNRGFEYRQLESLSKQQINEMHKNENKKRNESIYKYKIKKIQELKQDGIIKKYTDNQYKKKELGEIYGKKEITFEQFKQKSNALYQEDRLITKAVNSNFFLLSEMIKANNEEIENFKFFKFGKREVEKSYPITVSKFIENYNIKNNLFDINLIKSNKNYLFDKKKEEEYVEIINSIKVKLLDEKTLKLVQDIKKDFEAKQLKKDESMILINNKELKDTLKKHYEFLEDKKINDKSFNNLKYLLNSKQRIITKTKDYVFLSEENKKEISKLTYATKLLKKKIQNIPNTKLETLLNMQPKYPLDKNNPKSINIYINKYRFIVEA